MAKFNPSNSIQSVPTLCSRVSQFPYYSCEIINEYLLFCIIWTNATSCPRVEAYFAHNKIWLSDLHEDMKNGNRKSRSFQQLEWYYIISIACYILKFHSICFKNSVLFLIVYPGLMTDPTVECSGITPYISLRLAGRTRHTTTASNSFKMKSSERMKKYQIDS